MTSTKIIMTPLDPLHSRPGRGSAPPAGRPAALTGSSAALTAARPATRGAYYEGEKNKEVYYLSVLRQNSIIISCQK